MMKRDSWDEDGMYIIAYTEVGKHLLDYLYLVFNVHPSIPYYSHPKILEYYDYLTNYIVTTMCDHPDKGSAIICIQSLDAYRGINDDDIPLFDERRNELVLLLLYILNYLSYYLEVSDSKLYRVYSLTEDTLMVVNQRLSKEANDLVFRS